MATPFIGEIRLFPYARGVPAGWAPCDGTLLPTSQYTALYALLGTTYGGDGSSTFATPDLRGRVPVHVGAGPGLSPWILGEAAGAETVSLQRQELPAHDHGLLVTAATADTAAPGPAATFAAGGLQIYGPLAPPGQTLDPRTVGPAGSSQPHQNCMPTLPLNFGIAFDGIFPQRP